MIAATIVADSINQHNDRITTFELTLPKSLVAQFNTHGMVRRNSASSRAIPTAKVIDQITHDPYLPSRWGSNKKGMQPGDALAQATSADLTTLALDIRDAVLSGVERMAALGAAKEDINRYLEPWMWSTIVATATEWENYFKQRDHDDAQSAHAKLARLMREAMDDSVPVRRYGRLNVKTEADLWHLPYVTNDERYTLRPEVLPRLSAVRCARVSYGRQGETRDVMDELRRYEDFPRNGHWSPLEMPCRAEPDGAFDDGGNLTMWFGPYRGWKPLRKLYGGESGTFRMGTQHDDKRWTEL